MKHDETWWNYRTSKPSILVTVKGCRKHMKTEAFSGGFYRQNLITEILRTNICKYETNTFNSDMWISLMRNLANNAEINSCLTASTYLTTLLAMKNEWWNYRTSKPSKFVTVKGCRKHMKTEAFGGGLMRVRVSEYARWYQMECQNKCQIKCQNICHIDCQKEWERHKNNDMYMQERLPEKMSHRMSGVIPDRMPESPSEYIY